MSRLEYAFHGLKQSNKAGKYWADRLGGDSGAISPRLLALLGFGAAAGPGAEKGIRRLFQTRPLQRLSARFNKREQSRINRIGNAAQTPAQGTAPLSQQAIQAEAQLNPEMWPMLMRGARVFQKSPGATQGMQQAFRFMQSPIRQASAKPPKMSPHYTRFRYDFLSQVGSKGRTAKLGGEILGRGRYTKKPSLNTLRMERMDPFVPFNRNPSISQFLLSKQTASFSDTLLGTARNTEKWGYRILGGSFAVGIGKQLWDRADHGPSIDPETQRKFDKGLTMAEWWRKHRHGTRKVLDYRREQHRKQYPPQMGPWLPLQGPRIRDATPPPRHLPSMDPYFPGGPKNPYLHRSKWGNEIEEPQGNEKRIDRTRFVYGEEHARWGADGPPSSVPTGQTIMSGKNLPKWRGRGKWDWHSRKAEKAP